MANQPNKIYAPNLFENFGLADEQPPTLQIVSIAEGLPAVQGNFSLINGDFFSPNYVKGRAGWRISSDGNVEFSNGVFRGTLEAVALNIPDSTTASSFHVDTFGNVWWGANVATGYAGATASVLATGLATFKNVYVGGSTIQYQATDQGIGTFGDGSDGAGVADGSTALAGATLAGSTYTMTRDVYYTNLTVSTGVTIKPSGYRIFGTGTLSMNGTAVIHRNGNAGGVGGNASGGNPGGAGGTGGAALADGYLKGTDASTNGTQGGSTGGASEPSSGTNKTNSIGVDGVLGGGTSTAVAGTVTASNVKLIANWHLSTLLDIGSSGATVKYDGSANSTGGKGGASSSSGESGAGGGGGGSAGGILAIYFRNISVGASASITANGGVGGKGGDGISQGHSGQGGGGGSGGNVILVYNTLSNSGTISANGGAGGAGGTGGPVNGTAGANGNNGYVRLFNLSL